MATIGHMPAEFNRKKIKEWNSAIFEIVGEIESYTIPRNADGPNWVFTDALLETAIPNTFNGEFLIAIVNVPIELNWYSRRLTENRVVFTLNEIKEILKYFNIPVENIIYRLLYAYTLVYRRSNNQIPTAVAHTDFTHDETRGCIFDMNGIKTDIIYSCHNPIICSDCVERLRQEKISDETITKCQKEIRRIRKKLFYRMTDFIKQYPLWSLAISGTTAIILGAIGSVFGSYIYEAIK